MKRLTLAILTCLLSSGCASMLTDVATDVATRVLTDPAVKQGMVDVASEVLERQGGSLVARAVAEAADKLVGPETPLGTILAMIVGTGVLGHGGVIAHRKHFHGKQKNG